MTIILRDKTSLEHFFVTLQHFEKCSGPKVNEDKTEAYWLGSSHNCKQVLKIKTVNKPMKILGVYFTYNARLKQELNFDATIKSLKKTLLAVEKPHNFWKNSNYKNIRNAKIHLPSLRINPRQTSYQECELSLYIIFYGMENRIKSNA